MYPLEVGYITQEVKPRNYDDASVKYYRYRKERMETLRKAYQKARDELKRMKIGKYVTELPDGQYMLSSCATIRLVNPDKAGGSFGMKKFRELKPVVSEEMEIVPDNRIRRRKRARKIMWEAVTADEFEYVISYGDTLDELSDRMGVPKSILSKKYRGAIRNQLESDDGKPLYKSAYSYFFVRCIPLDDVPDEMDEICEDSEYCV